MSGTTFKKLDKNRYRKVYRYLRKKPVITYQADKPVSMESYYIDFDGSSTSGTYNFTVTFPSAPHVTATSVDSNSNSQANVNVFVSSVTKTQVVFELSALAECRVHFHAIYIKC